MLPIHGIQALATLLELPRQSHGIRVDGNPPVRIVKLQSNLGRSGLWFIRRAVVDQGRKVDSPKSLGTVLAQSEQYCVNEVAFARPIGAGNRYEASLNWGAIDFGPQRFETPRFNFF